MCTFQPPAERQTVGPPYASSYSADEACSTIHPAQLLHPDPSQEALVRSIHSSDRTVDSTPWPIDAFLAQLQLLGAYASYCLAGAIWIWTKQSSAVTGQSEVKRFYDSLVDVVMATTNQRDVAPAGLGQASTTEAYM